jgi:hypothetical protein
MSTTAIIPPTYYSNKLHGKYTAIGEPSHDAFLTNI